MAIAITSPARAVAGIDPHKRSGTVAVVAVSGELLACESFDISVSGLARLLAVLADAGVIIDRIGVEGSSGLGRPVARALTAAGLPPAAKHVADPPAAWEALHTIRTWRESLVLQRVRLLTEAEAVLTSLPIAIRDQLPATSKVMAAMTALATIEIDHAALTPADRLKLARLRATLDAVTALKVSSKKSTSRSRTCSTIWAAHSPK